MPIVLALVGALHAGAFKAIPRVLIPAIFALHWVDDSYALFLFILMASGASVLLLLRISVFREPSALRFAIGAALNGAILLAMVQTGPRLPLVFLFGLVFSYSRTSLGSFLKTSVPKRTAVTMGAFADSCQGLGMTLGPIILAPLLIQAGKDGQALQLLAHRTALCQVAVFAIFALLLARAHCHRQGESHGLAWQVGRKCVVFQEKVREYLKVHSRQKEVRGS
jgi:hypothetical protein